MLSHIFKLLAVTSITLVGLSRSEAISYLLGGADWTDECGTVRKLIDFITVSFLGKGVESY
jgi:hypothetical protein